MIMQSRADKSQYDVWGSLNNDPSWSWDGLLTYFKKSEIFTPPNAYQTANGVQYDLSVHGLNGRIHVGFPNFFFNQSQLWVQTSELLGIPSSPDLANGNAHAVGVAPDSLNAANNTRYAFVAYLTVFLNLLFYRCSAACAYYTPFADRPNLTVILNAIASRIIWDSSTGTLARASEVEYIADDGSVKRIPAGKEVIVSAGTIGSPKILELSGVGNAT